MKRLLKIYMPFGRAAVQETIEYRFDMAVYTLGMSMTIFVLYYLWKAVYGASGVAVMNGFSMTDMICYIILSNFMMTFMDTDTVWYIADEVRNGTIAMNLIKPVNYHLRIFFRQLGAGLITALFMMVPVVGGLYIYKFAVLGEVIPVQNIVAFLISGFLGFVVLFLFDFIFAMMAFYTQNLWGIGFSKIALVRLMNGTLIPLVFFPNWAQRVFEFLPFKSMTYTPVVIYLDKFSGSIFSHLMLQVMWIGILGAVNFIIWKTAIKKLTVQGG